MRRVLLLSLLVCTAVPVRAGSYRDSLAFSVAYDDFDLYTVTAFSLSNTYYAKPVSLREGVPNALVPIADRIPNYSISFGFNSFSLPIDDTEFLIGGGGTFYGSGNIGGGFGLNVGIFDFYDRTEFSLSGGLLVNYYPDIVGGLNLSYYYLDYAGVTGSSITITPGLWSYLPEQKIRLGVDLPIEISGDFGNTVTVSPYLRVYPNRTCSLGFGANVEIPELGGTFVDILVGLGVDTGQVFAGLSYTQQVSPDTATFSVSGGFGVSF